MGEFRVTLFSPHCTLGIIQVCHLNEVRLHPHGDKGFRLLAVGSALPEREWVALPISYGAKGAS